MTTTPRSSRPARRRHGTAPGRTLLQGVGVLLAVVALGALALTSSKGPGYLGFQPYKADVKDPGALRAHNAVRLSGVRVGQVIGVEGKAEGGATVSFKLDPGQRSLPADSEVVVRGQGLLGARYLEIVPGTSSERVADGGTLQAAHNGLSFGVPDALDTFDKETRGRLGTMLRELGTGLAGRGADLNDTLRTTADAARDFRGLANTILERHGAAQRLMPNLERLSAVGDANREHLSAMLAPAAAGLRPLAEEREALRDTIDVAVPALAATAAGLRDGRQVLDGAEVLARAATRTLPAAPAALRATNRLLRESRTPLERTTALLADVPATVPDVLAITDALKPVLPRLQEGATTATPIVDQVATHACDVANMAENWRSILNVGVPGGRAGLGGLTSFRISVMGGASLAVGDSLEPAMVDNFAQEIYAPACVHSPGPVYDTVFLPEDGK